MQIGIIGSGTVAQTLGTKLVELGLEVMLGSRTPAKLDDWRVRVSERGRIGGLADTAAFGDIVLNCTAGVGSLDALQMAGAENLRGKILIDVANPLDYSQGMPPTLAVSNTDSLGEQVQRALPETRVVKALNTVNAALMVNPGLLPEEHSIFVCGNDAAAKSEVTGLLRGWFGWRSIIDLGDITNARAIEMWLPLWIRLYGTLGTPLFNLRLVRNQ
ncbi:MAG: NADPH-dependent F420 reductase [Chloroflexota bacterium]